MARKPGVRIEPVEVEPNDARHGRLVDELADGGPSRGGMVWGMPPLPDGDMWADIVGAAAITGLEPNNIRGRLVRAGQYVQDFPAPWKFFGLQWWKVSELTGWVAAGAASDQDTATDVTP